jgi:hypothetical protein
MVMKVVVVVWCFAASTAPFLKKSNKTYQVLCRATVVFSAEVRLPLLGHPAIARTMAIEMMVEFFLDHTGMLTRRLAEPYCSPGTMVREGGVPTNFC